MQRVKRIAIVAYDGVDELDLAGTLAPLRKASEIDEGGVTLAAEVIGSGPFRLSSGLTVLPDVKFTMLYDFSCLDAVVLPGGRGASAAVQDTNLSNFLLSAKNASVPFYTVCSGVLILRDLHLLDGLLVACHGQKAHLLAASGCRLGAGVIRDKWLVSSGGFAPGDGLKGVEIAFHLLRDIAPDLVAPVAAKMELWPQTSLHCAEEIL
ncbi:MAG: DJ-1/PfpI family protein [Alphaproteobacteria bacterium]|nr:DJ-1/PfpI family protein [Alphaproteobacteria bacterium]